MSSYLAHKRKGFQGSAPSAFDGFGNRSRSFDGVDDYVTIPDNPSLPTGAQTISAWVKTENVGDYADIVSHWDNAGEAGFVILKLQDNQIAFYITNTGSTAGNGARFTQTGSGNTINVGSWYHVSCVFDPSTSMKIYINGILTSTNSNSIHSSIYDSGNDLFIGERADIANRNWHGNIADVRIYDTDLTATDISHLYAGTNITTNLVGHWLTDADNLLDAAGTNHGTNYGTKYSYDNPSPPVEFGSASRDFNGVADYVDANSISSLNNATSFSLGFWCKKTASNNVVSVGSRIGDTNGFWLSWWSDGNIYATIRNAEIISASYSLPYTSEWVYLSMTFDGSQIEANRVKTYVNGSLAATGRGSSSLSSNGADNFLIGLWNSVYSNGNIADVRIYDTDLTASQISDIYNGTNITTNLVGHWLTDNDDVEDKAGTNDGTNFGSTYSYDNPPMDLIPSRQASRSFNGASDHVDLGDVDGSAWQGSNKKFSGSLWVNPSSIIGNSAIFNKASNTSNQYEWTVTKIGSDIRFIWAGSLNPTNYSFQQTTDSPLVVNEWLHFAFTYDGTKVVADRIKLYINGSIGTYSHTLVGSPSEIQNGTQPLCIGGEWVSSGNANFEHSGKIADVRIYDTDLTDSQILAIYNGTTDRTNLIGQWLTNSDDVLDHAGTNNGINYGSTYSNDSPS